MSMTLQAQVEVALASLVKAASFELVKLFESQFGAQEEENQIPRSPVGGEKRSIGVQVDDDVFLLPQFLEPEPSPGGGCLEDPIDVLLKGCVIPPELLLSSEAETLTDPEWSSVIKAGEVVADPDITELEFCDPDPEGLTDDGPQTESVLQEVVKASEPARSACVAQKLVVIQPRAGDLAMGQSVSFVCPLVIKEEIVMPEVIKEEIVMPEVKEIVMPEVKEIVMPEVKEIVMPEVKEIVMPEVIKEEIVMPEVKEIVMPEVKEIVMPEVKEIVMPEVKEIVMPEVKEIVMPNVKSLDLPMKADPSETCDSAVKDTINGPPPSDRAVTSSQAMIHSPAESKISPEVKMELTSPDVKLRHPCEVRLVNVLDIAGGKTPPSAAEGNTPSSLLPKDLRRHQGSHTGRRPCCFSASEDGVWRLRRAGGHTCRTCGKTFRRKKVLRRHERFHTGERPYPCSQCPKTFALRKSLRRHLRFHTGERPHTCSQCSKSFRLRDNLKAHLRFHSGEKPYSCGTCGKTFRISRNLERHKLSHCENFVPSFRMIAGFKLL